VYHLIKTRPKALFLLNNILGGHKKISYLTRRDKCTTRIPSASPHRKVRMS
jgi:hypothetical protein